MSSSNSQCLITKYFRKYPLQDPTTNLITSSKQEGSPFSSTTSSNIPHGNIHMIPNDSASTEAANTCKTTSLCLSSVIVDPPKTSQQTANEAEAKRHPFEEIGHSDLVEIATIILFDRLFRLLNSGLKIFVHLTGRWADICIILGHLSIPIQLKTAIDNTSLNITRSVWRGLTGLFCSFTPDLLEALLQNPDTITLELIKLGVRSIFLVPANQQHRIDLSKVTDITHSHLHSYGIDVVDLIPNISKLFSPYLFTTLQSLPQMLALFDSTGKCANHQTEMRHLTQFISNTCNYLRITPVLPCLRFDNFTSVLNSNRLWRVQVKVAGSSAGGSQIQLTTPNVVNGIPGRSYYFRHHFDMLICAPSQSSDEHAFIPISYLAERNMLGPNPYTSNPSICYNSIPIQFKAKLSDSQSVLNLFNKIPHSGLNYSDLGYSSVVLFGSNYRNLPEYIKSAVIYSALNGEEQQIELEKVINYKEEQRMIPPKASRHTSINPLYIWACGGPAGGCRQLFTNYSNASTVGRHKDAKNVIVHSSSFTPVILRVEPSDPRYKKILIRESKTGNRYKLCDEYDISMDKNTGMTMRSVI